MMMDFFSILFPVITGSGVNVQEMVSNQLMRICREPVSGKPFAE